MPLTTTQQAKLKELDKAGVLHRCPRCNNMIPSEMAELVQIPLAFPTKENQHFRAIAQTCPICLNIRFLSPAVLS